MSNPLVLSCENLHKSFHDGEREVKVLKGANLTIAKGESVAVIGASGSGKSTLLHLLGGLDKPDTGSVHVLDHDLTVIREKKRCEIRNHYLGFVYQFHHLLPEFTALENVAMPLLIGKVEPKEAKRQAEEILINVGLKERIKHKPAQLSGGERQRVAIARAIVTKPACVLADEPTGNLDQKTAMQVLEMMAELQQNISTSFLFVTHDLQLASQMDRVLQMSDGQVVISQL